MQNLTLLNMKCVLYLSILCAYLFGYYYVNFLTLLFYSLCFALRFCRNTWYESGA